MKVTCRGGVPLRFRLLAWLNIAVQVAFPLASAFTPAVVASSEQHFLQHPSAMPVAKTQVYTLVAGETTASVARKYNMSVAALHKLNQLRTFSRGFEHLQPGDELEVPLAPLPVVKWGDSAPSSAATAPQPADVHAQKLAGLANQTGAFLANNPNSDAAASLARGLVTNEANHRTQQWLGQFGTARVQLDVDKNFLLKNSQLDLLVPLSEQQDRLVFTQGSLHRTDERTQANLGGGQRWFNDDWMVGGNTFLDYDLSGDHARLGMGVEYGRDFMKFGANSYLRLSNWKNVTELANYAARPANGWDIRAEAYLPAYPQLGGKLRYEQYYGNEVALFGKEELQKNPRAVTAGVNYTPVPLVTLGTEHQLGSNGKNDSRINFQLNYRLGESWQSHINPAAVAASRTLAGSRYDLVERNNHIVLDYQKQNILRLTLPDSIIHDAGQTITLTAEVMTEHGLSHIDWDSAALVAAGGRVTETAVDTLTITLPPYQYSSSRNINNSYTLSAVAHDSQGNVSNRAVTQIIVTAQSASEGHSQLQAQPETLVADTLSTSHIIVHLRDGNNQPIVGAVSQLTLPFSFVANAKQSQRQRAPSAAPHLGEITETAPGEYQASLTAGTEAGKVTITPRFAGNALGVTPLTVLLKGNSSDLNPGVSSLEATPQTIVANGSDRSQVRLTLRDSNKNLVSGQRVTFDSSLADSVLSSVTEQGDGRYTADLSGTQAGEAKITANIAGSAFAVAAATVTLTAGVPVAVNATLRASPLSITADGTAQSTLTLTLKDSSNNPVSGQTITTGTLTGSAASGAKVGSWTAGSAGVYSAPLTGTLAGTVTVLPQVNGGNAVASGVTVTLTAGVPVAANATLSASPTIIVDDGIAKSILTLTLKDSNNNPVPGQTVSTGTLTGSAANGVTVGSWTASSAGVYSAPLTGTLAGTVTVLPQVNGGNAVASGVTVTLTPGAPVAANATLSASPLSITADGTAQSTLTLTLKDSNNNPVPGQIISTGTLTGSAANGTKVGSWSANQPWVRVDNAGNVSFTGTASSSTKTVTIKAAPNGGGDPLVYTFTVKNWFTNNGSTNMNWSAAAQYCSVQARIQPTIANLSSGQNNRAMGSLWGEWGTLTKYTGSGFVDANYWTSEMSDEGGHTTVGMTTGPINTQSSDDNPNYVVCRQAL